MFNQNSGLVRTWIKVIHDEQKTIEQIPNISNLRETVLAVLATEATP